VAAKPLYNSFKRSSAAFDVTKGKMSSHEKYCCHWGNDRAIFCAQNINFMPRKDGMVKEKE